MNSFIGTCLKVDQILDLILYILVLFQDLILGHWSFDFVLYLLFLGAQKPAWLLDVLFEAGKLSVNFCLDMLKREQTWPEGWVLTNSGLTGAKYVPILWVLSCGTDPIKAQIKSLPPFHPQRPRCTQTDFNLQPALKLQILKLEPLTMPIASVCQFWKNYDETSEFSLSPLPINSMQLNFSQFHFLLFPTSAPLVILLPNWPPLQKPGSGACASLPCLPAFSIAQFLAHSFPASLFPSPDAGPLQQLVPPTDHHPSKTCRLSDTRLHCCNALKCDIFLCAEVFFFAMCCKALKCDIFQCTVYNSLKCDTLHCSAVQCQLLYAILSTLNTGLLHCNKLLQCTVKNYSAALYSSSIFKQNPAPSTLVT